MVSTLPSTLAATSTLPSLTLHFFRCQGRHCQRLCGTVPRVGGPGRGRGKDCELYKYCQLWASTLKRH